MLFRVCDSHLQEAPEALRESLLAERFGAARAAAEAAAAAAVERAADAFRAMLEEAGVGASSRWVFDLYFLLNKKYKLCCLCERWRSRGGSCVVSLMG